jgi:methylated-DNA-protein-cysteine methyltransferase-like protein
MPSTLYARIYAAVKRIPTGRVATYGQVARLAGLPRHARQVGYALSTLQDDRVPWHRVVNSKGEISLRALPMVENQQRHLLLREGIRFNRRGHLSLERYQWRPKA